MATKMYCWNCEDIVDTYNGNYGIYCESCGIILKEKIKENGEKI